jgi:hypothetical protein
MGWRGNARGKIILAENPGVKKEGYRLPLQFEVQAIPLNLNPAK